MYFSQIALKRALAAIHEAKKTPANRCGAARVGTDGATSRTETPPKRRDGRQRPPFEVAHGAHDADFLQIDPETLTVRCGACAGELNATVKE